MNFAQRSVFLMLALFTRQLCHAQVLLPGATVSHAGGRGTASFVATTSPPSAGDEAAARAGLTSLAANFGHPDDLAGLELVSRRESLVGIHYRFQQKINGIVVEGSDVVVSLRRSDGSLYQAANNYHPVSQPVALPARVLTDNEALDRAWAHLRVHDRLTGRPGTKLLYVPVNGGFRLVHRVRISTGAPFGHWEHRIDAETGEIISVRERTIERKAQKTPLPDFAAWKGSVLSRATATAEFDAAHPLSVTPPQVLAVTNGSARVFDPDPRTTLNNASLTNASPASAFTNAYFTRTLLGIQVNGGVYSLTGAWVRIIDFELPNTQPSTTTSGSWTNSRGANAFNDVMCYFHIDQSQRYLQSLGYAGATGIQQLSIEVDSDGDNGADNAYYDPDANRLAFGHGGVDDAEDADVILHEYGHAINHGIVPSWTGGDTGAIGEGFGDYWGASYSQTRPNGTNFNPHWVASWDGHSADTWPGRFLNMTNLTYDHSHYYEAHETIASIDNYSDQLWGTPLFQAFLDLRAQGIPREEIDRIVIESFFSVTSAPKMRDMAAATIAAAQELYPSGPHALVFFAKFTKQLILTAYPLLPPAILNPLPNDILLTGQTVIVRWNRPSPPTNIVQWAGTNAAIRIECQDIRPPAQIFSDNVESGTNGWTRGHTIGTRDWTIRSNFSQSATHSWQATNINTMTDQSLYSPPITFTNIPGFAPVLYFSHMIDTDTGYDGGVVEISTNNGTTWRDIGTNATAYGYDYIIAGETVLAGRPAFSGDYGTNFHRTRIPLNAYTGQTVKIRFFFVSDGFVGGNGWYVDDVYIQQEPVWQFVTNVAANITAQPWKLPGTPGTNLQLRLRYFTSASNVSAWAESLPLILSADTDGDGIPDAWETRYFTNTLFSTGTTDRDGDGSTDLQEFIAGTLPNNSASVLRINALQQDGPANLIQWTSLSNRAYLIEWAPSITTAVWTTFGPETPGIPPLNVITDTPSATTTRYYRVRAQ